MRLDKFLVDVGLGSRTDVKKVLKQKRVQVNGKTETSAKRQIDERKDEVLLDERILVYEKYLYYLLNKPKGVISATEDKEHQTVLDLLDDLARQKGVFPVGRLDIDTHGLLLLTNNGHLAHAMLSPKKHVAKVYQAHVDGLMTEKDCRQFKEGIVLKDFTCHPAALTLVSCDDSYQTSLVRITLSEGKFHQIKRMVRACGKEVTDLQRLQMGPLTLDENLGLGEFRRLLPEELASLSIFGVEI